VAISYGPKLGLLYNSLIGESYYDADRLFLQSLDAIIQASVINFTAPVPPVSPNAGDAYYVQVSPPPSGAWAGRGGQIAVWDAQLTLSGTNTVNPGWLFVTPLNGWVVWNTSLSGLYVYTSGTWNAITTVVPPITSYSDQIGSGTASLTTNVVKTWSLVFGQQVTADTISYDVSNADNTSAIYDIGIYDTSGNLLNSTGPLPGTTFAPATGYQNQTLIGSQTVFPEGNYFLAITGNANTLILGSAPSQFLATSAHNSGASSGGTLPSTISIPPTSWSIDTSRPSISLH
jgi:hypothetical protein